MAEPLPTPFLHSEIRSSTTVIPSESPSYARLLPGLLAAVTLVILPMCFLGNISGHDLPFHLSSWLEVSRQWREGILYPRWAVWANFGFGEPRFIFYPPISWFAGAALGTVLPWRMVPGSLLWITLVVAGLAMFRLSRRWLPSPAAELAAIFFAVNPYHLLIVYYRSDFAELIASAVFPLLVLSAVEIVDRGVSAILPASVILAVMWLANAPLAVLVSYSFVLFLLVGCLSIKSAKPIWPGLAAIATGLGLSCFYVLPAAYEQRWVDINQALVEPLQIANNFIFTHTNGPEYLWFNWKASAVVLLMAGAIGISALFARTAFKEETHTGRSYASVPVARVLIWRMLLALAAVAIFMIFPVSRFAWAYFPKLRFVQFPWRWMALAGVPCAMFVAAATLRTRRKWIAWTAIWLVLTSVAIAMIYDAPWDSDDVTSLVAAFNSNQGYDGTDEYAPLGSDHYDLVSNAPLVTALDGDGNAVAPKAGVHIKVQAWLPQRRLIFLESLNPVTIAPKLLNYPAWRATINGHVVPIQSAADTFQMQIQAPSGSSRLQLTFTRTWDRTLGFIISLISLVVLIVGTIWRRTAGRLPHYLRKSDGL